MLSVCSFVHSTQSLVPHPPPNKNKNKNKTKALGALKWSWANNKMLVIKHWCTEVPCVTFEVYSGKTLSEF